LKEREFEWVREVTDGTMTGGWETAAALEASTGEWVAWWNTRRLHSFCGRIPPAEAEAAFWANRPSQPE
jgi:putative transposase